jgi:hypothetical protein
MTAHSSLPSFAAVATALGLVACGGSPSGETSGASSAAVSSTPAATADSDGGTCAQHDLFGSYTITYNNGQPFADPNNQNVEIVRNESSSDPTVTLGADGAPNTSPFPAKNIAILQQFDCFALFADLDPQYRTEICGTNPISEERLAVYGVGYNPTGIGTTTGAVGNEVGKFGPGDTSFTWNYDVPDDVWLYAEGVGTVVSATFTQTGPCEVTYEQVSVGPSFYPGHAPTAAELVTAKYVLQSK